MGVVRARDHVYGDVARRRAVLEHIEHGQTRAVGQAHVQHDGVRARALGQHQRLLACLGDDGLVVELARQAFEDGGELGIVFDDEERAATTIARGWWARPAHRRRAARPAPGGATGARAGQERDSIQASRPAAQARSA